jgi:hypothetical protein
MATLTTDGQTLVVRLTPLEKLAAFRGDVRVPLSAVEEADVDTNPWQALRGIRAPGTGLPGVIAYGVRRYAGGQDFAALRGTRPAVRVDLNDSSPFGRLVISVSDPQASAGAVRAAAERAREGGLRG